MRSHFALVGAAMLSISTGVLFADSGSQASDIRMPEFIAPILVDNKIEKDQAKIPITMSGYPVCLFLSDARSIADAYAQGGREAATALVRGKVFEGVCILDEPLDNVSSCEGPVKYLVDGKDKTHACVKEHQPEVLFMYQVLLAQGASKKALGQ